MFALLSLLNAGTFEFKNGRCQNETGASGLNPQVLTQCSDLKDKILIGQRLSALDLRFSNLWKADLSESAFIKSDVSQVNWRDGIFRKGDCRDSQFSGADLRGLVGPASAWRSCRLDGADLRGAKLGRARFLNCSLRRADLRFAYLSHTSFEGSDLRGAKLIDSVVAQTNFHKALFDSETLLPFSEREALKRGMIKREK